MLAKISGKTFVVTGGAGFIGSNLSGVLVGGGSRVIAYDNLSSGKLKLVESLLNNKNFKFVRGDLLDYNRFSRLCKNERPDAIVHLAANPEVKKGLKDTKLDLMQGVVATYNVLEASRLNDIKGILFPSSSVVYGNATEKPTPETYGPLKPVSLYGASKLAAEGYISAFSSLYGMDSYMYRLANVVGNNLTHGVIWDFITKLKKDKNTLNVLGDGTQKKAYIDVFDCINAMLYIYSKPGSSGSIYNISSDDQISVGSIARMVIERFSRKARIRYGSGKTGWNGDLPNTFISNRKLMDSGFKMRYRKSKDVIEAALSCF